MTTGNTPSDPTPEAIAEQFMALAMDVVPTIMMGLKGLFGGQEINIEVRGFRSNGEGYERCTVNQADMVDYRIKVK